MSETWPTNADLHREHLRLLADHRETMIRLRDLRDEFRDFRQHAGANLASLNEIITELTAEVAKNPEFTAMVAGLLRTLTFNLGGWQFRGETRPGDRAPAAESARLAGGDEAGKPGRRALFRYAPCPVEAVFGPDDRVPCLLPLGHEGKHEYVTAPEEPDEPPAPDWDPGPEVDDESGMSEYRYLTTPEEPQ